VQPSDQIPVFRPRRVNPVISVITNTTRKIKNRSFAIPAAATAMEIRALSPLSNVIVNLESMAPIYSGPFLFYVKKADIK
jgi:hypothetical protein